MLRVLKVKMDLELGEGLSVEQAARAWVAGFMELARMRPGFYWRNGVRRIEFSFKKFRAVRRI